MIRADYDPIDKTLSGAALTAGSVGSVASAAIAALLSNRSGAAFFTTLAPAALVCGAGGYFYARYRMRKAVEVILG